MAGFTISCNNCGTKIITGDDFKSMNDKVSIFKSNEGFFMWCETCENNTEFEDSIK